MGLLNTAPLLYYEKYSKYNFQGETIMYAAAQSPKQDGDENLLVTFYPKSIFMRFKSEQEDKPVYESVPYIKIIQLGTGRELIDRKASKADKGRFAKQWEGFENNIKVQLDGIPIGHLPLIQPEEVSLCKHYKIYTVEHLANMVDSSIVKLGLNGRDLVNRATKYLDGTNTYTDKRLDEYEKTVKELKEQIEQLSKPKKRKSRKKTEEIEVVDNESIDDNTESSTTNSLV